MSLRIYNMFHTGEIDREELEHLITDTINREMPGAVIFGFCYVARGVRVRTSLGEVDIEIDWNEITIKEPNESTTIKQN